MIGSLRGRLIVKQPPQLLIEVGGVGYELEAPMSTFYALPATGEEIRLLTHLVVREDAQVLYGFVREEERRLFRLLIKVSGVGPKIALAILSGSDADAFASCIAAGDTASLIRIPGVGRKTAERLILELRDRVTTDAGATPTLGEAAGGGPRGEALFRRAGALPRGRSCGRRRRGGLGGTAFGRREINDESRRPEIGVL